MMHMSNIYNIAYYNMIHELIKKIKIKIEPEAYSQF